MAIYYDTINKQHHIEVFTIDGNYIGDGSSFGGAREMQKAALPEDLHDYYAGIGTDGQPLFYDMPDEISRKYGILQDA